MVYLCSKNSKFGVLSLIYSHLKTLLEMTIYSKLFVVCPRVNTLGNVPDSRAVFGEVQMIRSWCDPHWFPLISSRLVIFRGTWYSKLFGILAASNIVVLVRRLFAEMTTLFAATLHERPNCRWKILINNVLQWFAD